ncbi:Chaperone protein dnaJ 20, chloroplastic [Apostasia shenzhenica]|uniref:Chaperone protein dnaJ 20, chloroplastic n=1 Tax=Apostasia shenzhenica TaxID=1088818 RepID=A0A2I0BGP1_9ASPA|nr:Chaperone protein dnaJ 20, chloroplastic [Apostasia shenzhenica]
MALQCSISPHFPKPLFFSTARTRFAASPTAVRVRAAATKYDILEVVETAAPQEIKAAFRRQALRWHPDLCLAGKDKDFCVEQFIRAREAYETLSDPLLRWNYDLSINPAGTTPPDVASGGGGAGCFGDLGAQLDGLKRKRHSRRAGPDSWACRIRRAHQS